MELKFRIMIHENTFKKVDFNGAKGLVFLGNKILVYRRDNKTSNLPLCIDLPGGGRENDESPFDSFKREIKEEFGIDCKSGWRGLKLGKKYTAGC